MKSNAVISDCGKYRYRLSRNWGGGKPCMFIMLNPSTADADQDDPTIRRCISYAQAWGCGELIVTNLFGIRATNPKDMLAADDPIGPDNMQHIKEAADYVVRGGYFPDERNGPVVCAWGAHGTYMGQGETVIGWLEDELITPMYLALTKGGQPRHPLYLPKDLKPKKWSEKRDSHD